MQSKQTKQDGTAAGRHGESKREQQQTDPQITELNGLTDSSEELEPTLEDGTKAPDKEPAPDERD
ncbi:MAG TPA: hypothetical protein VFR58_02540 [Flavisolibacter sp.]|nr:hypothetical protein [Flavisolibacter sp.]